MACSCLTLCYVVMTNRIQNSSIIFSPVVKKKHPTGHC
uniref:Uncharacterized protein n=1 Tax=Anguilla anguilla TaxID=7936 RepID=A0A0E9PB57_ANGAN